MIECPRLRLSRCDECPDICDDTGQPVDEEDCVECLNDRERCEELWGDARRDEG